MAGDNPATLRRNRMSARRPISESEVLIKDPNEGYISVQSARDRRSVATVALVMIDGLVYSQLRIILPFTLALTAWLIGVTSGHHLRSLVTWASRAPSSTDAMRFNRT